MKTTDSKVINIFRKQAIAFIHWVNSDEAIDVSGDIELIRQANTFEEIRQVLAKHDVDGLFMSFIKS